MSWDGCYCSIHTFKAHSLVFFFFFFFSGSEVSKQQLLPAFVTTKSFTILSPTESALDWSLARQMCKMSDLKSPAI